MTNEFQPLSIEEVLDIEAQARLERALVLRSMIAAAVSWVRSKFSAKTTVATA